LVGTLLSNAVENYGYLVQNIAFVKDKWHLFWNWTQHILLAESNYKVFAEFWQ